MINDEKPIVRNIKQILSLKTILVLESQINKVIYNVQDPKLEKIIIKTFHSFPKILGITRDKFSSKQKVSLRMNMDNTSFVQTGLGLLEKLSVKVQKSTYKSFSIRIFSYLVVDVEAVYLRSFPILPQHKPNISNISMI